MNKFLEEKMKEDVTGIAARLWCDPRVEDRVMDPEFCEVVAEALEKHARHAVSLLWPVVARAKGACLDNDLLHEDFGGHLDALARALKSIGELDDKN